MVASRSSRQRRWMRTDSPKGVSQIVFSIPKRDGPSPALQGMHDARAANAARIVRFPIKQDQIGALSRERDMAPGP